MYFLTASCYKFAVIYGNYSLFYIFSKCKNCKVLNYHK